VSGGCRTRQIFQLRWYNTYTQQKNQHGAIKNIRIFLVVFTLVRNNGQHTKNSPVFYVTTCASAPQSRPGKIETTRPLKVAPAPPSPPLTYRGKS